MTIIAPRIPLNDGHDIPQLGLGTWPMDDEQVEKAIVTAIELGYRHIDTAAKYGNETGVGRGVAASGVPREELFVTTKLDGTYQGGDRAIAGLESSLERLGLDYVDLLLIHWPLPQRDEYVSTFRTFARLRELGLTRSIGVSNFLPEHLERVIADTGIVPAVNQIQLSPYIARHQQRDFDSAHGIVTQSWSPLGGDGAHVLDDATIAEIAEREGRTAGQVVLRWHLQNGLVPLPKSGHPLRIAENLEVFGWQLSDADMAAIDALDQPGTGVDSAVTGH